ncbi:hypothetical protein BH09MYX1_BH09MYX1_35230 [soil metagenome]
MVHPPGLAPRRARAYVPAAPPEGTKRPLLVLFDGQNVFDDEGSFAGGWYAHEAVDKLVAWRPVAPVIIGLDHGGVARIDELTPFSDGRRGGKLDAIVGTLVDELLPRAHSSFDLEYGPGAHFVGGSSLGGLAALYTHLKRPDVFGGALAMSPSLWFTRKKVDTFVSEQKNPYRSRIYLDAGAREGGGRMLPLTEAMASHFRNRGWAKPDEVRDLRVMLRPDARGGHDEGSWRRRFPKALRFLCEP